MYYICQYMDKRGYWLRIFLYRIEIITKPRARTNEIVWHKYETRNYAAVISTYSSSAVDIQGWEVFEMCIQKLIKRYILYEMWNFINLHSDIVLHCHQKQQEIIFQYTSERKCIQCTIPFHYECKKYFPEYEWATAWFGMSQVQFAYVQGYKKVICMWATWISWRCYSLVTNIKLRAGISRPIAKISQLNLTSLN